MSFSLPRLNENAPGPMARTPGVLDEQRGHDQKHSVTQAAHVQNVEAIYDLLFRAYLVSVAESSAAVFGGSRLHKKDASLSCG